MIIRQGDLAFIRLSEPSTTPSDTPQEPVVIARGETSGHWHTLKGGTMHREDNDLYIDVPGPEDAVVVVEPVSHAARHAPVSLPPGRYRVPGMPDKDAIWIGQREYTPARIVPSGD